tara:strand:+ start:404 stop:706 length:303 start_codon:yes stop_codon:yes gene_type:complete
MANNRSTKAQVLKRFPNSSITQADTLMLSYKDGKKWEQSPICMNLNCRSTELRYEGKNEIYDVDVYTCGDCKTISVQGYETIRTGGNVGCKEDLYEARGW